MNRRLLVAFVCALVAATCIGYLVYRALDRRPGAAPAIASANIVVATRNLGAGALIGAQDLRIAKWFGTAPRGTFVRMEDVMNRGIVSPIYEDEPILADRLAAAGSGAGLAALIPQGMRAFAVKVDEVVGVSGFVTPGMRVDVLMTGIPPGDSAASGPRVKTLMQNIQVLSAGANLHRDSEGKPQQVPVVNVLVTPEQAEALSLASNQTHIQLVLRNPVDTHVATPSGTAMAQLFGVSAAVTASQKSEPKREAGVEFAGSRFPPVSSDPAVKPVQAGLRVVEVLNGTARTEAQFELKGSHP
jgi:pilus assembly protein CpaB